MLDVFFLPNNERAPNSDIQLFVGAGTNAGFNAEVTDAKVWKKPRGVSVVHLFCVGGGGGGGGGFSAAAGSGKGGGGGGASSGYSSLIVPARLIPDKLYIMPGNGGVGGAAGGAGGGGSPSYVFLYPDSGFTANNALIVSQAANSPNGGGGAGTSTTGGGGGTPGSSFGISAGIWAALGVFQSVAGQTAQGGGAANSNAGNYTYSAGALMFPGTGGGGSGATTNGTGGGYAQASFIGPVFEAFPTISAAGVSGSGGILFGPPIYPFFVTGGFGGGGINGAAGGNGGDGSVFGAGGGGGGGGTTGGIGGDGGPGLVAITCW